MSDAPTKEEEIEFLNTLYGDPIRPDASKAGRNLIIGALLLLSVARFHAKVQATTLFPITFTDAGVLPTVLSLLAVLLMANFAGKVLPDVLRFREVDMRVVRFIHAQQVATATETARSIDEDAYGHRSDGHEDPWWEEVGAFRREAEKAIKAIHKKLGRRLMPRIVLLARLVLEVSLPLGLAAFALWEAQGQWHW